ncbi:class I SAM-dependent methyltransferase [Rhizobium sp. FKL33]|uniref:class I SAM-dependent methyltransferase n=1 Tax=Rhizobium sp. FKL33 TaxID=2562307 RepID=UPI0010C12750|nr:class I SAM-dependent methyltransferase [Rhizobium sp. FKL33]
MPIHSTNSFPSAHAGIHYSEFLELLTACSQVQRFIEVGVVGGHIFSKIHADRAIGIGPDLAISADIAANKNEVYLYRMSSNLFFDEKYNDAILGGAPDFVFLDGLHNIEALMLDFINIEKISERSASVLIHDCLPLNLEMTHRERETALRAGAATPFRGFWTGDVWKIIPILREYRSDLRLDLLDCPPTGLLCVTGINPESRILIENYDGIIERYKYYQLCHNSISELYSEILSSRTFLEAIVQSGRIVAAIPHGNQSIEKCL